MLLSSPVNLIVLCCMPVMVIAFMSLLMNGTAKDYRIPIAIIDLDGSEYSELVVKRVSQKSSIAVQNCDMEEAIKKVSTGKLEAAYIIKKGFMQKILDDDIDGIVQILKSPSSISAEIIGELISSEVIRLSSNVMAADYVVQEYVKMGKAPNVMVQKNIWQEAWKYTDSQWEPEPLMTIDYQEISGGKLTNQTNAGQSNHLPNIVYGMMISYLMFSMLIASGWMIIERREGIIKRILSLPIELSTYIMNNILSAVVLNGITTGMAMILITYLFNIPYIYFTKTILLFTAYLLSLGAISIFLACILKSISQLQIVIPTLTLASSFFGGAFINLSEISSRFKHIAFITPQYWFMQGTKKIFAASNSLAALWEILMLLIFFIVFLFISIAMLKRSRDFE